MTGPTTSPLTDRVVLITGAARGIGAATARAAATVGAKVALLGLEPELLKKLADELGPRHAWFECDVTDQAAVDRAVAGTVDTFGGIDVVLANAGVAPRGTVAVTPVDALTRTIEVNLLGVVRTVSATLPHVTHRRGYFLLVSSVAAFSVLPGMAAYCASKAGVEQFGNVLRSEIAHKGVSVGTAHMSWVRTDMVEDARADMPGLAQLIDRTPGPLGAYTSVEDCATEFVAAMENRRKRVYVPRSLNVVSAMRTLLLGPVGSAAMRRQAAALVPTLEEEVSRLGGRHFGEHSAS